MFLHPQGQGELCDPDLPNAIVWDTVTCKHCSYIWHVKPLANPEDIGGRCKVCMGLICRACYDSMMKGHPCVTVEKWLETTEKKFRLSMW
jgi:hypothetical protein